MAPSPQHVLPRRYPTFCMVDPSGGLSRQHFIRGRRGCHQQTQLAALYNLGLGTFWLARGTGEADLVLCINDLEIFEATRHQSPTSCQGLGNLEPPARPEVALWSANPREEKIYVTLQVAKALATCRINPPSCQGKKKFLATWSFQVAHYLCSTSSLAQARHANR